MSNPDTEIGGLAVDRLRSLIERIERLEEEQKALSSDIRRHLCRSQISRL